MKEFLAYPVLLVFLIGTPAFADFADGKAAYDKGDYAAALTEWEPLADQGDADAQVYLGVMYQFGQGVIQDDKEAAKWYRLAAQQGYAGAQSKLVDMLLDGKDTALDYEVAFKWSKLAAAQGHVVAQYNLGKLYLVYVGTTSHSKGKAMDKIHGYMWWSLAASEGHKPAKKGLVSIATMMSQDQIDQANKFAIDCKARGYKNC